MAAEKISFEPIDEETRKARAAVYTGKGSTMVEMGWTKPYNIFMPKNFEYMIDDLKNFEVREDDIFMVTYPKAGSTLVQEMVWQIAHDLDMEGGKEIVFTRAPFLEMTCLMSEKAAAVPSLETIKSGDTMAKIKAFMSNSVGYTSQVAAPRVIKTHLPIELLPKDILKAKILWVARNPKDTLLSFFNHEKLLPVHGLREDAFDEFFANFLKGQTLYGDYWNFMKMMWPHRNHENVHMIWFEDIRKDLKGSVQEIAKFLGFSKFAENEEKMAKLLDHLHIDNFKNNDAVNMKPPKGHVPDEVRNNFNFIRGGHVGGWKAQLDQAKKDEIDAWIEKGNADLNIPMKFE